MGFFVGFFALGLLANVGAWAHQEQEVAAWPAPIALDEEHRALRLEVLGTWIDTQGTATIVDAAGVNFSKFAAKPVSKNATLPDNAAQWVHLRVNALPSKGNSIKSIDRIVDYLPLVLEVPIPLLDYLDLYHLNEKGQWEIQRAGDLLANAYWSYPSRYPHFELHLRQGASHDIFLRLRGHTSITEPLKISSPAEYYQHLRIEHIFLGLVFGAMLIFLALCAVQGVLYRDAVYAWYGAYVGLALLGMGAFSGSGAYFLWNESPRWADAAPGAILLAVTSVAMQFVRLLTGVSIRDVRLNRVMLTLVVLGLVCALVYPFVPRHTIGRGMLAILFPIQAVAILGAAIWSWRGGDKVSGLVTLAYIPLGMSLLMALGHALGLTRAWTYSQDAIIGALIFEMPLLLIALNLRSRSRHGMIERSHALATQDALTGLLAAHLFKDRMRQTVLRSRTHKADAAIVFIELINYKQIMQIHGVTVAEQSLLRCVIKMRRLLRDVDVASRIADNQFGLILEGVSLRETAMQLCARLIAMGLMPLKGLKPEVTLQFHMSAVLLRECTREQETIEPMLVEMLKHMGPRTRKPIRFLENVSDTAQPLVSDGRDGFDSSGKQLAWGSDSLSAGTTDPNAFANAPTEPSPLASK